jgi:hypothetical protein
MKYYFLEPEVAGGLGQNTVMDRTVHPPVVTRLHYELDGWLGDELLETFPSFIITDRLGKKIVDTMFTGIRLASVEVSTSEQFRELYPSRTIPDFVWLKVLGRAGIDDFGIADDHRLVVSERALEALALKHAGVSDFGE